MSAMKKPQPWVIRKVSYATVALVVGVLGWVGWVDESTGEKIGEQATQIIPWILGVLAPAVAASKTHAGSDSAATDADAFIADRIANVPAAVQQAIGSVPGADQVAAAVISAIRAEERGEHSDTGTPMSADLKSVAEYYRGE